MTAMKNVTLPQFLTDAQIDHAVKLYEAHGMEAVGKVQREVIEPNMTAINEKLGQKNDARYLAYAVVYACSQADEAQWS